MFIVNISFLLAFTASLKYSAGEHIACIKAVIQNHTMEEAHWCLQWDVRTGQEKNVVKLPIKHSVVLKLQTWSSLMLRL